MKRIMLAGMVACALLSGAIHAEEKAVNPQHQRMKDCNAEAKAKELKGQPRKDFMKTCLSGSHAGSAAGEGATPPAPKADKAAADSAKQEKRAAQKEKMKTCNAEAKDKALKGQERKDFMKACLSG